MLLTREPAAALRPFIRTLWALDSTGSASVGNERVLPTGSMHVALRFAGAPFNIEGEDLGFGVVGGARSSAYVRSRGEARSIGVQFAPGAAGSLFGVPASELAERHTSLDDLWGRQASELRARLADAGSAEERLDVVEQFLASRLPRVHGLDPVIAHALERFRTAVPVAQVVEETGCSHRRFIQLFRETVGLSPKRFCRVRRLADVLRLAAVDREASLAELALAAGYSDQAHFSREFREITGITPGHYRRGAPSSAHHVAVPADAAARKNVQDSLAPAT